ncbi:MAG TPA: transposase [Cyclobacteriaceae bacterium]|nr:transposase [Cyclobacteriaceae bacterium]
MSIKTARGTEYQLYFCTFTCFKWMNLFELTDGYDCVYKWFNYLKDQKHANVVAYVIMPNHLHVILHLKDPSLSLNKIVGNGKRFMAYAIITRLEKGLYQGVLEVLHGSVTRRERRKGQKHRVFEESFDAKPIYTKYFLEQKIDYIHHNPIRGKWALVADVTHYPHSSASFYEEGNVFFFEPKHYSEL